MALAMWNVGAFVPVVRPAEPSGPVLDDPGRVVVAGVLQAERLEELALQKVVVLRAADLLDQRRQQVEVRVGRATGLTRLAFDRLRENHRDDFFELPRHRDGARELRELRDIGHPRPIDQQLFDGEPLVRLRPFRHVCAERIVHAQLSLVLQLEDGGRTVDLRQ
jgi:hypothetical protein